MYADSNHAVDQPFATELLRFSVSFLATLHACSPSPRAERYAILFRGSFVLRYPRATTTMKKTTKFLSRWSRHIDCSHSRERQAWHDLSKRHFGCWSWRYALFRVRALIYALALQILREITTAKMLHRYTSHSTLKKFVSFIVQSWVKVDACN